VNEQIEEPLVSYDGRGDAGTSLACAFASGLIAKLLSGKTPGDVLLAKAMTPHDVVTQLANCAKSDLPGYSAETCGRGLMRLPAEAFPGGSPSFQLTVPKRRRFD
jgi:hypothetical protein